MPKSAKLPDDKSLVFCFCGGPDDGRHFRFHKRHSIFGAADALWTATKRGAVGHKFHWFAHDAHPHRYRVIDKRENHRTITVTCEYVGRE